MMYKITALIIIALLILVVSVASQGPLVNAEGPAAWKTSGNFGTDPTVNFVGTTDNQPLVFKTDGNEVMSLHTNQVKMFGDNLNLKLTNISDLEQARFIGRRARGTQVAPAIVEEGDTAVIFRGQGFNGTRYKALADIRFFVDGTPSSTAMPGGILFRTTPFNDDSSDARMVIKNDGKVGIGTTDPFATFDVVGTGRFFGGTTGLQPVLSVTNHGGGIALHAFTNSTAGGSALLGDVTATTGTGIGVFAQVNSPEGNAGLFLNNAGGKILSAQTSNTEVFGVHGNGIVGIGLSFPQRNLHIKDVMRLEPRAAAPDSAALGDIYVDTSGALCFYDGISWSLAAGTGLCP